MDRFKQYITIIVCAVMAMSAADTLPCSAAETSSTVITLGAGLKEATEESRLVKIAAYNPEIASAEAAREFARFLPSVNASAGQTWLSNQPGAIAGTSSFYTGQRSSFSYSVTAQQTLFDFGGRTSRYKAAKASLEGARQDMQRIRNLVALDYIATHFNLLEADKIVMVAEKELESLLGHVKMAAALYDQGVITKNDLLQAKVKLSDTQQRLITARNQQKLATASLNTILARPLGAPLRAAEVDYDLTTPFGLEQAWDRAGEKRLEVAIINNEIIAADLQARAKKADYFPTVVAQGGYSYGENRYQLHQDNWSLMLGVNLNLFSGGATKAEVAKLTYRRDQLTEQKRKLLDDIRLEVEKWYRDEQNARERIAATKDAIAQAEENLRITRVRYQEGVGTATDVLDAITLRTLSETNYYRALYDMRRSHAGLLYAIGEELVAVYR